MQIEERSRLLAIAPLWRLGFRPFFLGGALFAALAIALWGLVLAGVISSWQPAGGVLGWHRHEMVFGFGAAIIAGFLLTAGQNWTGIPSLKGRGLLALAALWLLARLGWAFGLPPALLLQVELLFLPVVAVVVGRMIWKVRQLRNYPVVGVLLLLSMADAQVMAGLLQGDEAMQRQGVLAAIWLVALMMGLIGGRVIPFFIQAGLRRTAQVPALPWLERAALGGLLLLALLTAAGISLAPHPLLALLCGVLALLHGVRLWRWHDAALWQVPLLWSLYLAYGWLVVALAASALWHAGLLASASAGLHALTVGSMGGLILAMIARVSLGHTGRPLQPPAAMRWAFVLINLAALVRVLLGSQFAWGSPLAALLWLGAFALFCVFYGPMLCRARVDGQPG